MSTNTTYDEILKRYQDAAKAQNDANTAAAEQLKKDNAEIYEKSNKNLEKMADIEKKQTAAQYKEIYDTNAVNEYVRETKLAESMANAGLTNSGLNATQKTAIQTSRGNADSRARIAEQQAIDAIELKLMSDIAENDQKVAAFNAETDATLAQNNAQRLADAYNDYTTQIKDAQKGTADISKDVSDLAMDIYNASKQQDALGNTKPTMTIEEAYALAGKKLGAQADYSSLVNATLGGQFNNKTVVDSSGKKVNYLTDLTSIYNKILDNPTDEMSYTQLYSLYQNASGENKTNIVMSLLDVLSQLDTNTQAIVNNGLANYSVNISSALTSIQPLARDYQALMSGKAMTNMPTDPVHLNRILSKYEQKQMDGRAFSHARNHPEYIRNEYYIPLLKQLFEN